MKSITASFFGLIVALISPSVSSGQAIAAPQDGVITPTLDAERGVIQVSGVTGYYAIVKYSFTGTRVPNVRDAIIPQVFIGVGPHEWKYPEVYSKYPRTPGTNWGASVGIHEFGRIEDYSPSDFDNDGNPDYTDDTDGDGYTDWTEITSGSDPSNPGSTPTDRVPDYPGATPTEELKPCLKAWDLMTDANQNQNKELNQGEDASNLTLTVRADENGYYKFRFGPAFEPPHQADGRDETIPSTPIYNADRYEIVASGLPASRMEMSGNTPIERTNGTIKYPASAFHELSFKPITEEAGDIYLEIHDKQDGKGYPICRITVKLGSCLPCSSSSGDCRAGSVAGNTGPHNGANMSIGGGESANGRGGAQLLMNANHLKDFSNPQNLTASGTASAPVTTTSGANQRPRISSIATSTGTLRVQNVNTGIAAASYDVNFYHRNPNGTLSSSPATQLRVKGWDLNRNIKYLTLTEARYDNNPSDSIRSYVQSKFKQETITNGDRWTYFEGADVSNLDSQAPDNSFLRRTVRSRVDSGTQSFVVNGINESYPRRVDTISVSERRAHNNVWQEVSRIQETWIAFPWGLTLTKRERISGARRLAETFEYYTSSPADNYYAGRMKRYTNYDGSWADYSYTADGRISKIKRPFLNATPGSPDNICDITTYRYQAEGADIVIEQRIKNRRTSKAWYRNRVTSSREINETIVSTAHNATINTASNLITTTERFLAKPVNLAAVRNRNQTITPELVLRYGISANSGEVAKVVNPDGTGMLCTYQTSGFNRFKMCRIGAFDSTKTQIVAGKMTFQLIDPYGNTSTEWLYSLDFQGVQNRQKHMLTRSETNLDTLGRPRTFTTTFHDGSPRQISTKLYGCCGLRESVDIRGIKTTYHYDHLKRLETTASLGVVHGTQYNGMITRHLRVPEANARKDNHGHYTVRGGFAPQTSIRSQTRRNTAGEVTETWIASPTSDLLTQLQKTSYFYHYGAGQTFVNIGRYAQGNGITTKTVNPDGGVIVTNTYRDGRTRFQQGSGIHPVSYNYLTPKPSPSLNYATFITITRNLDRGLGFFTRFERLTQTGVDAAGRTVSTLIGKHGNLRNHIKHYYNPQGQLVRITDGDGVTTLFGYNAEGQQVQTATDLNGNNQIDLNIDRISFSETDCHLGPDNRTFVHQTRSQVMREKNSSNSWQITNLNQASIDGLKNWQTPFNKSTARSSQVTQLKVNGRNGDFTTTTIHASGRRSLAVHTSGLLRAQIEQNSAGQDITRTDYAYDHYNRVNRTTDKRTGDTTFTYFNNDQLRLTRLIRDKTTSADDITSSNIYDSMGRTIKVNKANTLAYNNQNRYTTSPNIILYRYNKRGEVLEVKGDQTYRRTYTYDGLSRMKTMTTYGSQTATTTWNYIEGRNLLANKRYADNRGPSYTYTNGGRLRTRTWARGVKTTYSYDFHGQPTGFGTNAKSGDLALIDYSDSTPDIRYTYTRWGAIEQVARAGRLHANYIYRDSSHLLLTLEAQSIENTQPGTFKLTRSYDDQLRPQSIYDGNLISQEYAYDTAGRLSATVKRSNNGIGKKFTYSYLADSGHLVSQIKGVAHTVNNSWEPYRNILTQKTNTNRSIGNISSYQYTVNKIGQRIKLTQSGAAHLKKTTVRNFYYNRQGELVRDDHTNQANDRVYQYDGIGNRQKAANTALLTSLPSVNNYGVNQLNQYTQTPIAITSPTYDPDGNMTRNSKGDLLTWDGENRLTKVVLAKNAGTVTYSYDHMSRRTVKTFGKTTTYYHYNGWNPIQEKKYAPREVVTKRYTWGKDLSGSPQGAGGVGGLLMVEEDLNKAATQYYYPTYDGNGNISEYLNTKGAIVAHYQYDPFGNLTTSTGPKASDFSHKFSTKIHDQETALYYYGYRYYDPVTGRWPSRDPIGERGGLNLYGMVGNSLTGRIDYLGLATVWHHIPPQQFRDFFTKIEVGIDEAKCGIFLDVEDHKALHNSFRIDGKKYNDFWKSLVDGLEKKLSAKEITAAEAKKIVRDTIDDKIANMGKFKEIYGRGAPIPMGLNYKDYSNMTKQKKGELIASVFEAKAAGKKLKFMGKAGQVGGKVVKIAGIAMIPSQYAKGKDHFEDRYGDIPVVPEISGAAQAALPIGPADGSATWDMSHEELIATKKPGFGLLFESLVNPTSPRWVPWMVYKKILHPK